MAPSPARPTTPAGPPAGVVWDLGNVIVDWDASAAIAAGVGAEEAARFLAADDFDFMAWNHGCDAGGSWDDAEAAVAASHPHWAEHARSYRRHFAASLRGEVPGTADLLRELHAAGVPMWGLTNWSHELYPHAPRLFDVLGLLEDVVVSGTEGVAKPDPRVYRVVERRAGLPLARLAFVDDRADNVAAASALGMHGLVFTDADALRADLRALGLPLRA
ncbi:MULTISPECIES: HAD family hydrolase [Nocardioides]|uniref:HAD family hydrolase n=1 Tax=Nocardioides TaxID=1839 RepID=UPI000702642C|nr:HAD family phosphatase [Nocardioides sp. Leaf307]KQQ43289.1 haloacid dehalogenase [Nocardioides sp. Leaf307]